MPSNATVSRNEDRLWAIASLAGFIIVVVVNALANILPINGVNTGDLSDEIPNLFVPAGLTFAIWGLIYLLLAGYSVAVLSEAFGKRPTKWWNAGDGRVFSINMIANAAWIFAWHYRLVPLSLGIMLAILVTLVILAERIVSRRGSASANDGFQSAGFPARMRRFFLSTPIFVYMGWICVATIANVTALLVTTGWDGFGFDPRIWTVVAIAAGASVALLLVFLRDAAAAPLVVVWAYAGIVIKRTATDGDFSRPIWIVAIVAAALIVFGIVSRFLATRRRS